MTSTGGAHHHSLMNGRSLRNRSPNQSSWTTSPSNYDGEVVLEFWRILCQIRTIKYCAEPSVRELPEYEGCLRFGNKFKRSLNPSRVSCQYQAVNACHQDFLSEHYISVQNSHVEDDVIAKRGTQGGGTI